ncbi:MAG TPA: sulfur carrier protein ThiS [Desulfitobacteriaceae bacterium]|nr:sulfur carrier protein ThiS [Desulfitobacteriaceae bacterium]
MKFNGQILQLNREIPLLQFVRENKYDLAKIAVELNGEIVPKAAYAEVILRDEDTLEVVNFVGGG